ncbi:MAG: ornithine carbamoyltransferase [Nitrosopumilus sp.]|nr:ornithine carbamoyltransferase [Nitrosopumilus sp.]
MKLATRDLLTVADLTPREFGGLVSRSITMKKRGAGRPLAGRTLAMIFEKPSTRTRASFEAGMHQLGGHAISLSSQETQLSRGESIEDTARTLSRYSDCIMARLYRHRSIERLAAASSVPVINGLTDSFHPCQTLADFMTIRERLGRMDGLKIAWLGDGNNVCSSLIQGAALAGSDVHVACPRSMRPDAGVVREASRSVRVRMTEDPAEAARGAHVVATDTHSSMHNKGVSRLSRLARYRVDARIMAGADPGAIFLHCLPATRGREVSADVIDGPQSAVWDEAENRLHTQKALLEALAGRPRAR